MDYNGVLTSEFIIRFFINLISLLILLRCIRYRNRAGSESLIGGFLLFGNGVFLVTSLLHNIEMSMGFAFGLFAIFSMLRYRTEALSIGDMTYLFVSISIALMSSVSSLNMFELSIINSTLCIIALFCDSHLLAQKTLEKLIMYENIDLIHPSRYNELIEDLTCRTGLKIDRVEIGDIDFLRDSASLRVFYFPLEASYEVPAPDPEPSKPVLRSVNK